jgi:MFS family permease
MLIIVVTIFALASILAAFAQTGDLAHQTGSSEIIGGAIAAQRLSIIDTHLPRANASRSPCEVDDRGMVAVGPLLGGWLTTYFSWRWAFGINIPFGILIIIRR